MAARKRDYRAEYEARQQRARQLGYQSYWHQRQTDREAKRIEKPGPRADFIRKSKQPPPGMTPAEVRRLWAKGEARMRAGKLDQASDIARQLGFRASPKGPAHRIFFYH